MVNIELVSVPPGTFLSPEQIAELSPRQELVIEHEPTPDGFDDAVLEPLTGSEGR